MKISKKITFLLLGGATLAFHLTGVAAAHVVVKPGDVKTSTEQIFTVSVPSERSSSTVSVKVAIPEDLTAVTPSVKPGWTIKTDKQGEGVNAVITAITWSGGDIGPGYRDEFTFSAKTPSHPMELQWKAYQTYRDGTTVSWDQQSSSQDKEGGTTGSFSVTKVAADSDQSIALKNTDIKVINAQATADKALYASIGGGILAIAALVIFIITRTRT